MICALVIQGASQNKLDHLKWRSMMESHVCACGIVLFACETSAFSYAFSMCLFWLRIDPSC